MKTKKCSKCGESKRLDLFYNNKSVRGGKTYWCKVCMDYQNNVVQKNSKSKWASKTYFKRKLNDPEYYLWKQSKHRALESGLEFSIAVNDIIIPKCCPYFGKPLEVRNKEWAPSLDRIHNDQGYIPGNVRVISYKANKMKNNASVSELLAFAKGVIAVHSKEVIDCAH